MLAYSIRSLHPVLLTIRPINSHPCDVDPELNAPGKRKHESNNEEQSERPAKSPKLGTTALAKAKEARRAERRRKKEQTREEEQRKKEEERKRKEEEYKQALEDWKNGREIDITQSFAGTLVVVPPTLVQQWVHEIGVHSDLNVHVRFLSVF